jgi:hypothetical protein
MSNYTRGPWTGPLRKVELCYAGEWREMCDDDDAGRKRIREQYRRTVKFKGATGWAIYRCTYPVRPDGSHGTPTKVRAFDLERAG